MIIFMVALVLVVFACACCSAFYVQHAYHKRKNNRKTEVPATDLDFLNDDQFAGMYGQAVFGNEFNPDGVVVGS